MSQVKGGRTKRNKSTPSKLRPTKRINASLTNLNMSLNIPPNLLFDFVGRLLGFEFVFLGEL